MRSASYRRLTGCFLFILLLPGPVAGAQETDLTGLAGRVSKDLSRKGAKTAVIYVFSGPEGQRTELGRQLADEFAEAMRAREKPITIFEREILAPIMEKHRLTRYANQQSVACWLGQRAGASSLVAGFLELHKDALLVTVRAFETATCHEITKQTETIFLSDERRALLAVELPPWTGPDTNGLSIALPPVGIPKFGVGGISYPMCLNCPNPRYTEDAREAGLSCTVVLRAVITTDGRATYIQVEKPCPLGLTEKVVDVVQQWKFKPATGPEGSPVEAWAPLEVNFRISKQPGP